jgi:hypothetical protein
MHTQNNISEDNLYQAYTDYIESFTPIAREEAEDMIQEHIIKVYKPYFLQAIKAVKIYVAQKLLGSRFQMLIDDPLRSKGPTPDTIYPWNIVDYLSNKDPRSKKL